MSAYQVYLFVHVAAAVVWVGAAAVQVILGTRVVRAADPARTLVLVRDAGWTGLHLYLPANLLALVSGVLLVHEGGWGFGTLWIDMGLAAWAVSFATGAAVLGPGWARAGKIADPEDEGADLLCRAVHRLVLVTLVDLAVLTGVVFAMAVKPTADDGVELVVGATTVVAVLALGSMVLRIDRRDGVAPRGSRAAVGG
jgi:uncharacterized membrane protein